MIPLGGSWRRSKNKVSKSVFLLPAPLKAVKIGGRIKYSSMRESEHCLISLTIMGTALTITLIAKRWAYTMGTSQGSGGGLSQFHT